MTERELFIINKCAELATTYYNSATLQGLFDIDEYIILTMGDIM